MAAKPLAGEPPPRLFELFAAAGMDPQRDLEMVIVPGPQQVEAFAARKVDLLFAHTPYLETAMVQHGGMLLVHTSGGELPSLAGNQIHALATTPERIARQPALIVAVTRAIARALALIRTDRAATVAALIASGATRGAERRQIEAIAAIYAAAVPATPAISVPGIERAVSRYPAHPRAPDFTQVKAADFVAAQFAAELAR